MTIHQVLQKTNNEIITDSDCVKIILSEYKRLFGNIPNYCDCQLTMYVQSIRNYYDTRST